MLRRDRTYTEGLMLRIKNKDQPAPEEVAALVADFLQEFGEAATVVYVRPGQAAGLQPPLGVRIEEKQNVTLGFIEAWARES